MKYRKINSCNLFVSVLFCNILHLPKPKQEQISQYRLTLFYLIAKLVIYYTYLLTKTKL